RRDADRTLARDADDSSKPSDVTFAHDAQASDEQTVFRPSGGDATRVKPNTAIRPAKQSAQASPDNTHSREHNDTLAHNKTLVMDSDAQTEAIAGAKTTVIKPDPR